jgi:hypothetical protein
MATHQGKRYNLNAPAVVSTTAARAIPVDSDDGPSTWLAIRSIRKETKLASITRGGNYVARSGTCAEQCVGGSIGRGGSNASRLARRKGRLRAGLRKCEAPQQ